MKLGKVLLDIGASALSTINPPIATAVMFLVNKFLDDDQQVTLESTGQDLMNRINLLPESTRQELLESDVTLQIQLSQERMNNSDNNVALSKVLNNSKTAQTIVMQSANLVFTTIFVYGLILLLSTIAQAVALIWYPEMEVERVKALKDVIPTWETIATMLTVPTIIIYRYFGAQSKDNRTLTNAINGYKTPTTGEALQSIMHRIRPNK